MPAMDLHRTITIKSQTTELHADNPNSHPDAKVLPSKGFDMNFKPVSYLLDSGSKVEYYDLYNQEYSGLLYNCRTLAADKLVEICEKEFALTNQPDYILSAKNAFTLPFCDPNSLVEVYGENFNEIDTDLFKNVSGDKTISFVVNSIQRGVYKERFAIPKELNLMRIATYTELNEKLVDYRKANNITEKIKIRDIEDEEISKLFIKLKDVNKRIQTANRDNKRDYRGRRIVQVPDENMHVLETNWRSKDKKINWKAN